MVSIICTGNADGARLIGDRARDRLADPPRGIGREFVAAAVFEFVDRLHQADIAFLDEIEELQTAIGVFLRDRDHETQVRLDHLLLRLAAFALALLHRLHDAAEIGDGLARLLGERLDAVAQLLDLVAIVVREIPPARAGQAADAAHPIGIELVAEILLEEVAAIDAMGFGKAQQAALRATSSRRLMPYI
jgi:hypothetical protein